MENATCGLGDGDCVGFVRECGVAVYDVALASNLHAEIGLAIVFIANWCGVDGDGGGVVRRSVSGGGRLGGVVGQNAHGLAIWHDCVGNRRVFWDIDDNGYANARFSAKRDIGYAPRTVSGSLKYLTA